MNNQPSSETAGPEKEQQSLDRRLFLRSIGKWSGAAIAAVGFGGTWLANAPKANAGIWINRWVLLVAADGSTDGALPLVQVDGSIGGNWAVDKFVCPREPILR